MPRRDRSGMRRPPKDCRPRAETERGNEEFLLCPSKLHVFGVVVEAQYKTSASRTLMRPSLRNAKSSSSNARLYLFWGTQKLLLPRSPLHARICPETSTRLGYAL